MFLGGRHRDSDAGRQPAGDDQGCHRAKSGGGDAATFRRARAVRAAERQHRNLGYGLRLRRAPMVGRHGELSTAFHPERSAAPTRHSSSAFTPTIERAVIEAIENATKSGSDFNVLHRTIRPDGTLRWLSGAGRTLLDERRTTAARSRHLTGRDRASYAGGAVSAGPEDGSRRTPGRRRGARLQQSADGDSRLLRAVARGRRAGRPPQVRHHGNSESGHARRKAHEPAPRLQPQGDHRADAARPEHHSSTICGPCSDA